MSFGLVYSGFLFGLAALAIPIIIHLIFRRRPKAVDLGSIRFLREILEKHARRRKIQRWLLLALRTLGIVLLVLMFGRPYFTERVGGGGERFLAVLIDRSASMQLQREGRRLLDQAIDEAKQVVHELGEDTRVEVALFDHDARPLVGGSRGSSVRPDTRGLLDSLAMPAVTYHATDYGAALQWARDVCAQSNRGRRDVHIFTDLQRSGLQWSDVQPMPADMIVHLHDLGRDSPNNVAVTRIDVSPPLASPGDAVRVSATVLNAGPFVLEEVPVALNLTSGQRPIAMREKVKLEPGALVTLQFELPALDEGLWRGSVRVEVLDDLAFDNQRHFAVMVAPPYQVLVVDGQPAKVPQMSETYFLETALRLAPRGQSYRGSRYQPTVVPGSEETTLPNLDRTDLVVLANVAGIASPSVGRLARFVRRGGGLLVFCGDRVSPQGYESLRKAGLGAGQILENVVSDDLPWRLHDWDQNHSIFLPFDDPQHGDLRSLSFYGYTRIQPGADATVLARFRRGSPALLERGLGKGKVLWFVSTCDPDWTDWPRRRLLLPLVHQMLGHLSGLNEGGPVRAQLLDTSGWLGEDASPGVYQRGDHWVVVNVDPRESETERCHVDDFVNRFQLTCDRQHESASTGLAAYGPRRLEVRENEFWHWVLFGLLGLLVLEFLIANRTAV